MSVFRAMWPITDPDAPVRDLIADARADLPAVARRHGVVLLADPERCAIRIARGQHIPGSGGAQRVVIAEIPAETIRDHHRGAAA